MKLVKIHNKDRGFKDLSTQIQIGSPQEVLQYLQRETISTFQMKELYTLLCKETLGLEQFVNSEYLYNENQTYKQTLNEYCVSSSLNNKSVYKINNKFSYVGNIRGAIQASTPVPSSVVKAYTLPLVALFSQLWDNENYQNFLTYDYFGIPQDQFLLDHQVLESQLRRSYNGTIDGQQARVLFLGAFVSPPSLMKRYVNQDIEGWEIVHPPSDLISTEVYGNNSLKVFLSKQITSYGKEQQLDYAFQPWQLYPSTKRLEFFALTQDYSNLSRLYSICRIVDKNLVSPIQEVYQFASNSFQRHFVEAYPLLQENIRYLHYINLDYSDANCEKFQLGTTLQNKLGYYNSLIENEYFASRRRYLLSNHPSYDVLRAVDPSYLQEQPQITDQKTNILALCYRENIYEDDYGFLHELGRYKIKFKFKIENAYKSQSGSPMLLLNTTQYFFNQLDTLHNTPYYISQSLFNVRILPIEGATALQKLKKNTNIGIIKEEYLYKSPKTWEASNFYDVKTDKMITEVFYPGRKYITFSNVESYKDLPEWKYFGNTAITTKFHLTPVDHYEDFNFFLNKYGQFLTYRTLNKRYFEFNGKPYIDCFGQTTQSFTQLDDGWYQGVTTIDKYFQGNSFLSFMLHQKQSELITSYFTDMIRLEIKDIEIQFVSFNQLLEEQFPDYLIMEGENANQELPEQDQDTEPDEDLDPNICYITIGVMDKYSPATILIPYAGDWLAQPMEYIVPLDQEISLEFPKNLQLRIQAIQDDQSFLAWHQEINGRWVQVSDTYGIQLDTNQQYYNLVIQYEGE